MSLSIKKHWEIVFLSTHRRGPQLGNNDIAKEIGVSKSTVKRWLQRYKDTGDVEEEYHSGRPKIESSKINQIINSSIKKDRTTSSKEIKHRLKRKGIEVSSRTVRRRLSEQGLYYGKTNFQTLFEKRTY